MNETKPKFHITKLIAILLAVSLVLLGLYGVSYTLVRNDLQKGLEPIRQELLAAPGAVAVKTKICAEPDSYNLPWHLEYHLFLTVEFAHMEQIGEDAALTLLNGGKERGEKEYSYDGIDYDDAVYNRSVTDTVFGRTHPVFVTLTDGDKSYTLRENSLYDKNVLAQGDAYETLRAPMVHEIVSILLQIVLVLGITYVLVLRSRRKKKREEAEAQRIQREEEKKADLTIGFQRILRDIQEEYAEKQERIGKRRKKVLLISVFCALIVLGIAVALVIGVVLLPGKQYSKALALQVEGRDAEAYALFAELGDFRDAGKICQAYDYEKALGYLAEGKQPAAYALLRGLSEYRAEAEECLTKYPHLKVLDAAPGDEVLLGSYEQDNDPENGAEAVEWIILKNENGIFYAVSKYVLDTKPYNQENKDGSTLKPWLKEEFSDMVFGELPDGFVSRVGLLSRDDMRVYDSTAGTKPEWTPYARAQGPEKHYYAGYSWWLDGEYFHGYGSGDVDMSVVIESGSYSNNVSPITGMNGVRPAILIDYSGNEINYYADDEAEAEKAAAAEETEANVRPATKSNTDTYNKKKCNRCSGTGKVTLHYGNSWNKKEGYRYGEKCGGCNGTGYVS